jgi:putative IMPACT (imprinted ancient) family translation regulator
VVRYFGGVKLGAGGLVRAYSGTASKLLDRVELAAASPRFPLSIRLAYGDERNARRILGRLGIAVVSADYAREVTLVVRVSEDERKAALEEIAELTSGRARFGSEGDAI